MSNYNLTLQSNNTDLQAILNIINELPEAGSGGTQATPVISVASNGLITATAGAKTSTHQLAFQAAKTITPNTASQIAVSGGYYTGGNITVAAVPTQTKSVTPTSSAQNITPDSGKFLSKVTVNGDSNLVAENIKSGVSIFGVSGTLVEGGRTSSGEQVEWSANEDAMVTGTLSSYFNDRVGAIGSYAFFANENIESVNFPMCTIVDYGAFQRCRSLTTVSFPNLITISHFAFDGCSKLTTTGFSTVTFIGNSAFRECNATTLNFPKCTTIDYGAFGNCSKLATVNFPVATIVSSYAFTRCSKLSELELPMATTIGDAAFSKCYKLSSIYLKSNSICQLYNSNAFTSTPYAGYSDYFSGTPYIYVPASLLASYKTATNWTYFSSYFSVISDISTEGDYD